MKLENQVVSLEYAKKLKEFGVKQESLFYWSLGDDRNTYEVKYQSYVSEVNEAPVGYYSAFTVAELGEMLPAGALGVYLNIFKNVDKGWLVGYGLEKTIEADTEADARAKMLIYLLENKIITL